MHAERCKGRAVFEGMRRLQDSLTILRAKSLGLSLMERCACAHPPHSRSTKNKKVPILVAFDVEVPAGSGSSDTAAGGDAAATSSSVAGAAGAAVTPVGVPHKMACIFKVGDDIRQDVLAMQVRSRSPHCARVCGVCRVGLGPPSPGCRTAQHHHTAPPPPCGSCVPLPAAPAAAPQVIRLLHDAFEAAGLNLYLRPYGCLPTGYECGIIEVRGCCVRVCAPPDRVRALVVRAAAAPAVQHCLTPALTLSPRGIRVL
jgi:hypothetical protein